MAEEKYTVKNAETGIDGMAVVIQKDSEDFRIIVSWGGRWDHVSVSLETRCPTWEEMCWIKNLFWNENETVIQYHPAKKDYVNNHEYCLHLWKPQKHTIPIPPANFVGIKT